MPPASPTPGPPPEELDSRQLAALARAGCRASFAVLVRRHAGPLLDFARTRVADAGEAEDLVQETLLVAWEKLARYDERWSFNTWLFTIAQRRAVSGWRRRRPKLAEEGELEGAGREPDPLQQADRRETSEKLWDLAREVLGPDQYSALWLSYAEGLDTAEIARILGRARPTVRVMMFRARTALRAQLSRAAPPQRSRIPVECEPPATAWAGETP